MKRKNNLLGSSNMSRMRAIVTSPAQMGIARVSIKTRFEVGVSINS